MCAEIFAFGEAIAGIKSSQDDLSWLLLLTQTAADLFEEALGGLLLQA